ncbi:DUF4199 family protein [Paraflavitalea sp. CAU 1676]|uniref:DUF4199 family protein n=1 Tax=Paraflavitalea sp. CAU 1676 TaxID=3032598 RepID=UPI0023DC3BAA|nr:DUF4199 family protein [Paraflavitalea sp. CAU 1676]MDF2189190.1 DUF4199 family protein [Paraflavitalea sp. CAU 1676]
MEKKTTSAVTAGLITAATLIVLALLLYFTKQHGEKWGQYAGLTIYMVSIVIGISIHAKQTGHSASFGILFSYGFRMVAVVISMMVLYTIASVYLFPEVKSEFLEFNRAAALKLQDKTPAQIDEDIRMLSKNYMILIIMGQLFYYMVLGAIAAVTGSIIAKKSAPQNQ